jgi:hypothetical protein
MDSTTNTLDQLSKLKEQSHMRMIGNAEITRKDFIIQYLLNRSLVVNNLDCEEAAKQASKAYDIATKEN